VTGISSDDPGEGIVETIIDDKYTLSMDNQIKKLPTEVVP
jgi:hypothetical protein